MGRQDTPTKDHILLPLCAGGLVMALRLSAFRITPALGATNPFVLHRDVQVEVYFRKGNYCVS